MRHGDDLAPFGAGALVRRHRADAGIDQRELARRAGLSVRALRDIEQGRVRHPRPASAQRLAAALGLGDTERTALLAAFTAPSGRQAGGQVRLGVLGPLVVQGGDLPVTIGAALPRALLGLLALQPRQVVSPAEIIDVLWDDRPPRTARNLVQVYIGQLRRALPDDRAGQSALRRSAGGYLLDLRDDQVDLTWFDHLRLLAEQARRGDDPRRALDQFDQALQVWRGPVLADAPAGLRAHPAAVAAAQRRIDAAVAFADTALAAGRPDAVPIRLRPLVRDEPLHEVLHARLMTALAEGGQQAAALRLYADVRARLADELGVEPGDELSAAHLHILQRPSSPPAPVPGPAPAQLPSGVRTFTGRTAALSRLDRLLRDAGNAPAVVTVTGPPGAGKTALAVHWAHRIRDLFPDGQLFVNLNGFDPGTTPVAPEEAVRRFLGAMGVAAQRIPPDPPGQLALYRELLAGRRMLVLLDNARDTGQVRPLLPGTPGCLTVVTSRNRLIGLVVDGAQPVVLDLLPPAEARQLLAARLGQDRLDAEPAATDDLIGLCARLPLALAIAAARAATEPSLPLAVLAAELRDSGRPLDALTGDDAASDIRAVFSWSYHALSPGAARLFRLLGLHPGPDTSAAAAASLAGLPLAQVRAQLAELTRAHLLTEPTAGRYTFHDLLRAYAAEQAHAHDAPGEEADALGRVLDHYLHTAYQGAVVLSPRRDPITPPAPRPGVLPERLTEQVPDVLAWFTAEHHPLLAAAGAAARTGHDVHAWQLAWSMADYLDWRGHSHDKITVQRIALESARRLADHATRARIHYGLAVTYDRQGLADEARVHFQRSFDVYREHGDVNGQAMSQRGLAAVAERQQSYAQALHHAGEALRLYRATGHEAGEARTLNSLGWYHALLGEYREALALCEQAHALLHKLGDQFGEAAALDSLGYVHSRLGAHDRAVDHFQQALDLCRGLGDRLHQAEVLVHLGDAHEAAGDPAAARDPLRSALTILEELDHPRAAEIRARLGELDRSPPATTAG